MITRGTVGMLVAAVVFGCGDAPNVRDPASTNEDARLVLAAMFEAVGGRAALDSMTTLAVRYDRTLYDDHPSSDGQPTQTEGLQVRDFRNGRFVSEERGTDVRAYHVRTVVTPNYAFEHDFIRDTTRGVEADAAWMAQYIQRQLQWYVYQALEDALRYTPDLRLDAPVEIDGVRHETLVFGDGNDATVTLLVNAETGLLTRRENRLTDAIRGELLLAVEFRDYRLVNGFPFPYEVTVFAGDEVAARYDITQMAVDAEIREALYEPPQ